MQRLLLRLNQCLHLLVIISSALDVTPMTNQDYVYIYITSKQSYLILHLRFCEIFSLLSSYHSSFISSSGSGLYLEKKKKSYITVIIISNTKIHNNNDINLQILWLYNNDIFPKDIEIQNNQQTERMTLRF